MIYSGFAVRCAFDLQDTKKRFTEGIRESITKGDIIWVTDVDMACQAKIILS